MKRAIMYYLLLMAVAILALSACRKSYDDDYEPERFEDDARLEISDTRNQ